MSQLRLHFLGAPHFEHNNKPAPIRAAKAVAALAYLAVNRAPQSRERLIGLLWAESTDDAARKNLRNTLWTIRKALGDDIFADGEDEHLLLSENVWLDVREFEDAADTSSEHALALYDGALLDGFALPDAPDFEIWHTTERERLAELYLHTLAAQVEEARARGEWQTVIALARRALESDNLQEPMHGVLMEAHARLGERAEALRQYDALHAILQRELGVEPLRETEKLRQQILDGNFAVAAPRVAVRVAKRPPVLGDEPRAPFVGRREERAALDEELQRAESGAARVILLSGEVGIGKSRLWQEWSSSLSPDVTVFETHALEATRHLLFAPLAEFFSRPAIMPRLLAPSSKLPRIWLAELTRVVPELRAELPAPPVAAGRTLPLPPALPLAEDRARIYEAFTQSLFALPATAAPIVFFMDDVHWADDATMDWLDYFVHSVNDDHRGHEHALLVVLAYRPEDAPAHLVHVSASWGRENLARRIELPRLTSEESARLLNALVSDPALKENLRARLQAQSAGNPYFLIELTRAAPAQVPLVLSELIRARLDKLPETARQVLQAAAVLEPDFEFTALRRTSGRDEEETLDALDTLLNASVLVERGGEYMFAHPLVATVVRQSLSGARRAFLHRRAAEALETTHAGRVEPIAARLATHYVEAGEPSKAAHYFESAAERALAVAAPSAAAEFYRQAIDLENTPARQMGLGQALMQQGDVAGVNRALQNALDGSVAHADAHGAAEASLALAQAAFGEGRADQVVQWVEKSQSFLDHDADPELHARAHFLLGASRRTTEETLAEAESNLTEAAHLATENDLPDLVASVRFELGNMLAESGDLDGAIDAFQDSIAVAELSGNKFQIILGHNNAAYHALLLGDLERAHQHVATALQLAESEEIRMPLQYLYSTRGEIALAEDKWDEAEEWFQRGMAEAERNGNVVQAANYRLNVGLAARGRGDLDGAIILIDAAREQARQLTAPHLQAQIDLWLTEVYLQRSERAAANEALRRVEAHLAHSDRMRLKEWASRLREQLNPRKKRERLH
jgi:DNA-binding SARP family transcriptional activator